MKIASRPGPTAARESGATLVEAAFALPLLFMFLLGLVDFGLVALNSNQAGNAARDGARAGIVEYVDRAVSPPLGADNKSSTGYRAIKDAIEKNLPGRTIPDADVDVVCLDGNTVIACATARPNIHRIRVTVQWEQPFISPVAQALGFGTVTVDGSSTMLLQSPGIVGGASAGECSVSAITIDPTSVDLAAPAPASLASDLQAEVFTTGECTNLTTTVQRPGAGGPVVICSAGPCGASLIDGDADELWEAGTATVTVTGTGSGLPISVPFEIVAPPPPPVCIVSTPTVVPRSPFAATVKPFAVRAGRLGANFNVNVAASDVCGDVEVTATPSGGPQLVLCGPAAACRGAVAYDRMTSSSWTAGPVEVRVSAASGEVATTSFTVTAPPCVPVVPSSVPRGNGNSGNLLNDLSIDFGSDCSSITARVLDTAGAQFDLCSPASAATLCNGIKTFKKSDGNWSGASGAVLLIDPVLDIHTIDITD